MILYIYISSNISLFYTVLSKGGVDKKSFDLFVFNFFGGIFNCQSVRLLSLQQGEKADQINDVS